jgi:hypothetical protein
MASVILGHGNILSFMLSIKMGVIIGLGYPFSSEAIFSVMAWVAFKIIFSLIHHA